MIEYYDCTDQTGNVSFTVFEGSPECGIIGTAPDVNCTIDGDLVTVAGSYTNTTNTTVDAPRFYETLTADGYLKIVPFAKYDGYTDTTAWPYTLLDFRKYDYDSSALTIYPITVGSNQLYDSTISAVIQYIPPNDDIDSFSLADTTIDTILDISASCTSGLLGQDEYNMMLVVGYNSTFFKKSTWNCSGGTVASGVIFGDDLEVLLGASDYANAESMAVVSPNALEPLWKDSDKGTLNRFVFFGLDFGDTWAKYTGEMYARDNENFNFTFSEYNHTIQNTVSNAYPFGTYFYSCDAPRGYVFANGTGSGYITIDSTMEFHSVIVQNESDLSLAIDVRQQGVRLQQAQCTLDGQVVSSGTTGICTFTGLGPSDNYTVYVTKGLTRRTAVFAIGDYYASQQAGNPCGFGSTQQCSAFVDNGRVYTYIWDIDKEQDTVTAVASFLLLHGVYPIGGATGYWDGTEIGATDASGAVNFDIDYEFYPHTILFTQTAFYNASEVVCLGTDPFLVLMREKADGTYGDDTDAQQAKGINEISGMMSSPLMMGSLVVVSATISGAYVGGLPGGLGLGAASAVMMSLNGLFPWSFTLIMLFLAVLIGGAAWRQTLGGGGGP